MKTKIVLVVQEGGSSGEFYVHAFNTVKEANANRRSCGKAAYRTSKPIVLPAPLTRVLLDFPGAEAEFYEVLKQVLTANLDILYPGEGT
jgi:hypothetical protein